MDSLQGRLLVSSPSLLDPHFRRTVVLIAHHDEEGAMGDHLEQLYNASYRRLVVQMYAICGDVAEAEDAVQDAFVAALRKQRELRQVANPRRTPRKPHA